MPANIITSPKATFDPCTHEEKKFFTPSLKKVMPMCDSYYVQCFAGYKVVEIQISRWNRV